MATVLYYTSYLIGPTSGDTKSGLSNHKEWIITFKPWLLPRIQARIGYIVVLLLLFCFVPRVCCYCVCMHCTCVVVTMLCNMCARDYVCALYGDLFCKWLSCVYLKVSVLICCCSRLSITIHIYNIYSVCNNHHLNMINIIANLHTKHQYWLY